jgi:hypothetical protein
VAAVRRKTCQWLLEAERAPTETLHWQPGKAEPEHRIQTVPSRKRQRLAQTQTQELQCRVASRTDRSRLRKEKAVVQRRRTFLFRLHLAVAAETGVGIETETETEALQKGMCLKASRLRSQRHWMGSLAALLRMLKRLEETASLQSPFQRLRRQNPLKPLQTFLRCREQRRQRPRRRKPKPLRAWKPRTFPVQWAVQRRL